MRPLQHRIANLGEGHRLDWFKLAKLSKVSIRDLAHTGN